MIAIVDYGIGNVQAFVNIYKRLNVSVARASSAEVLAEADHIILPGVGSFDWAMQRLENTGLRKVLDKQVLEKKIPVLGVCVGMQIMTRSSEEGSVCGLGWFDADVKRFKFGPEDEELVLPHMGWNDVKAAQSNPLLSDSNSDSRFYFLHSYFVAADRESDVIAVAEYGDSFSCGIQSANCYGVQFHPEKSHGWGIQLLKNFAET